MNRKVFLISFVLSLCVLGGCSSFLQSYKDNTETFHDVVALAAFIEIENDDGTINQEKARDLYAEAQRISEKIDQLETITADQFHNYLQNYIRQSDSRPSRKLVLQRVVSRAQRMIDTKMQEMNVDAGKVQDYTVVAKELVTVVLETIAPYQTI